MLNAISPIDGRYADKTKELRAYFSEYALIRYRVFVEIQYFIALCQYGLPQLESFDEEVIDDLNAVFDSTTLNSHVIRNQPSIFLVEKRLALLE